MKPVPFSKCSSCRRQNWKCQLLRFTYFVSTPILCHGFKICILDDSVLFLNP